MHIAKALQDVIGGPEFKAEAHGIGHPSAQFHTGVVTGFNVISQRTHFLSEPAREAWSAGCSKQARRFGVCF